MIRGIHHAAISTPDMDRLLERYDRVLVPEINMGQLALLLQGRYLCKVHRLNKVQGLPFSASEILDRIAELSKAEES